MIVRTSINPAARALAEIAGVPAIGGALLGALLGTAGARRDELVGTGGGLAVLRWIEVAGADDGTGEATSSRDAGAGVQPALAATSSSASIRRPSAAIGPSFRFTYSGPLPRLTTAVHHSVPVHTSYLARARSRGTFLNELSTTSR
jgi:hypothetical protein